MTGRKLVWVCAAALVWWCFLTTAQAQGAADPRQAFVHWTDPANSPFSNGNVDQAGLKRCLQEMQGFAQDEAGVMGVFRQLKRDMLASGDWAADAQRYEAFERALMTTVRDTVIQVRTSVLQEYGRSNPAGCDTLFGVGDIGSWADPTKVPDFSMDVDWSLFGLDKRVTDPRPAGGAGNPIPLFAKAFEQRLGVGPASMDVVVTGSHWEAEAGVFVTQGGKTWAQMNFTDFKRLQRIPGGGVKLVQSRPEYIPFERALTQLWADPEARVLFDDNGHLRKELNLKDNEELRAQFDRLMDAVDARVEMPKLDSAKAPGGVMDMKYHQFHEGIEATSLNPFKKMEKSLKYATRGWTIYTKGLAYLKAEGMDPRALAEARFSGLPAQLQALADAKSANDKVHRAWLDFCAEQGLRLDLTTPRDQITGLESAHQGLTAKFDAALAGSESYEAKVAEVLGARPGTQDFAQRVAEFESRVSGLLGFEAEVAHTYRLREILRMQGADQAATKKLRADALRALADDYRLLDEQYQRSPDGEWHRSLLGEVTEIQRMNDEGRLADVGPLLARMDAFFKLPESKRSGFLEFLGLSEFGKSLKEHMPTLLAENRPVAEGYGPGSVRTMLSDLGLDRAVEQAGSVAGMANEALNLAELAVTCAEAFTDGTLSDFDKAKKMGWILAQEIGSRFPTTSPLLLAYNGFQALKSGNPDEVARFLLLLAMPSSMVPQLIESMGHAAASMAKTAIFDAQLEAMFEQTTFDPEVGKEPVDVWMADPDKVRYTFKVFIASTGSEYTPENLHLLFERILTGEERGSAGNTSGAGYFVNKAVDDVLAALLIDGRHALFVQDEAMAGLLAAQAEVDQALDGFSPRPTHGDVSTTFTVRDYDVLIDYRNNEIKAASQNLSPGVRKAVEDLLAIRRDLRERIVKRLAELVVASFEERRRALFVEAMDLMGPLLEQLNALGKALYVEEGLAAGVLEAMQGSWFSGQESGDRARTVDTWLNAYRAVVQIREGLVRQGLDYGLAKNLLNGPGGPLAGSPPLVLDPGRDLALADKAKEEFGRIPSDLRTLLSGLKGQAADITGADAKAFKDLAFLRYRAMLLEFWLRGSNGAVFKGWYDADKPLSEDAFAGLIMAEAAKLNQEPEGGWPELLETNRKLLEKTARAYNRALTAIRVGFQLDVQSSPNELHLIPGQTATLTLAPKVKGVDLTWKVTGLPPGVSVDLRNGKLSGEASATLTFTAQAEGAQSGTVAIRLAPDLLRQQPDLRLNGELPGRSLDVALVVEAPQPGPVVVRVVELADGQATSTGIAGAQVVLTNQAGDKVELAEAGRGMYGHKSVPPGQWTVTATAQGYQGRAAAKLTVPGTDGGPGDATLALSKVRSVLLVSVADPERTPLSGAKVTLFQGGARVGEAVADDSGLARLADLAPGEYLVSAQADGHEPLSGRKVVVGEGETRTKVALKPFLAEVLIRVVDPQGRPVDGAQVRLGGKSLATVQGQALFSGVAPDEKLEARAAMPGFPEAKGVLAVRPTAQGQRFELALTVTVGGRIVVQVVDQDGGPVPGAVVRLSGPGADDVQELDADARGTAVFDNLPLGAYYAQASGVGYLAADSRELVLTEQRSDQTLRFPLAAGMSLSVRVQDKTGQLIPGATVSLDGGQPALAPTGTLSLTLPAGPHKITALARGYEQVEVAYSAAPKAKPQDTLVLTLASAFSLVVEVRAPDGGLLNADVTLVQSGKTVGTASGKAPVFAEPPTGTVTIQASAQGYQPGTSAPVQVAPTPDQPVQTVNMVLVPLEPAPVTTKPQGGEAHGDFEKSMPTDLASPRPDIPSQPVFPQYSGDQGGTFHVYVRDGQGEQVPEAWAVVQAPDGSEFFMPAWGGGGVRFANMPHGVYVISAVAPGWNLKQAVRLDLGPTTNKQKPRVILLPEPALRVKLVDHEGKPVNGRVGLDGDWRNAPNGGMVFEHVAPGKHNLWAWDGGERKVKTSYQVKSGQSADTTLTLPPPEQPVPGEWTYSSYGDKDGLRTYRNVKMGGYPLTAGHGQAAAFCWAQGMSAIMEQPSENLTNWQGTVVDKDGNKVCRTKSDGGTEATCRGFKDVTCAPPPPQPPCDPNDPLCGLDVDIP